MLPDLFAFKLVLFAQSEKIKLLSDPACSVESLFPLGFPPGAQKRSHSLISTNACSLLGNTKNVLGVLGTCQVIARFNSSPVKLVFERKTVTGFTVVKQRSRFAISMFFVFRVEASEPFPCWAVLGDTPTAMHVGRVCHYEKSKECSQRPLNANKCSGANTCRCGRNTKWNRCS